MKLQVMATTDILNQDWYDKNEKPINSLQQQVYRVNSNIHILEKIFLFPFEVVYSDYPLVWGLIIDSLFETSALIIWKSVVDTESGRYTVQKLKKEIYRNLVDANYRNRLKEICKDVDFDRSATKLRKEITKFRDEHVSSFSFKINGAPTSREIDGRKLIFEELKELRYDLNLLYNAINFNTEGKWLPNQYNPDFVSPDGKKEQSDIDQLFETLMKYSNWLNLPERSANIWSVVRKNMSESDVAYMNKYRSFYGLNKIS